MIEEIKLETDLLNGDISRAIRNLQKLQFEYGKTAQIEIEVEDKGYYEPSWVPQITLRYEYKNKFGM